MEREVARVAMSIGVPAMMLVFFFAVKSMIKRNKH